MKEQLIKKTSTMENKELVILFIRRKGKSSQNPKDLMNSCPLLKKIKN